jgi:hypothetical protein
MRSTLAFELIFEIPTRMSNTDVLCTMRRWPRPHSRGLPSRKDWLHPAYDKNQGTL